MPSNYVQLQSNEEKPVDAKERLTQYEYVSSSCNFNLMFVPNLRQSQSQRKSAAATFSSLFAIWMYHDTTAAHLAVGYSLSPVCSAAVLLPEGLRDQCCTESTFKQSLKTYLFAQH